MSRKILALILTAAGFFFAASLFARSPRDKKKNLRQDDPQPLTQRVIAPAVMLAQKIIHVPTIFVRREEVELYVTVADDRSAIVTGLSPENFEIFDEKVRQKIIKFSTEDAPISVCILLDASGSLGEKLPDSIMAVQEFLKHANPQDEYMLIVFGDTKERRGPQLVIGPTANTENLQGAMLSLEKAEGLTPFYDAVYLGLNVLKRNATLSRKVLLVISDGGDNHSRYTKNDVKDFLKEGDTQIYCIGILEMLAYRGRTPEELAGPALLAELSDISGGQMFAIDDTRSFQDNEILKDELKDIAERISINLRTQYVLSYKPSNLVRDGKWRRVKVKLNIPKGILPSKAELPLHVYVREGYYAPSK